MTSTAKTSKSEKSRYEIYVERSFKEETWVSSLIEFDTIDNLEVTIKENSFSNDKEELQKLNKHLSEYIQKVQLLERRNNELETEINDLKSKPLRVGEMYDKELSQLRAKLTETQTQMSTLDIELNILNEKYQKECELHSEAQKTVENLKQNEKMATEEYVKIEKKVTILEEEVTFLKEVIEELSEYQKPSGQFKRIEEMRQVHVEEVNKLLEELERTKAELRNLHKIKIYLAKRLKRESALKEELTKKREEIVELQTKLTITETEVKTNLVSSSEELIDANRVELESEIAQYRTLLKKGEIHIKGQKFPEDVNPKPKDSPPNSDPPRTPPQPAGKNENPENPEKNLTKPETNGPSLYDPVNMKKLIGSLVKNTGGQK